MPQAGVHAFIGLTLRKIIPHEKWLFPAIIIGALLPDLDIMFVGLGMLVGIANAEHFFHRTITHSVFSLIILYVSFLVIGEVQKNPNYRTVGKGIAIGILSHLVADSFLWFRGIHILWPLPGGYINLWENFHIPDIIHNLLLASEFLLFRIYGWFIINSFLKQPHEHGWFLKYISKWMRLEFYLFTVFILLAMTDFSGYKILFGLAYFPSLLMAILITVLMRNSLEPALERKI